jgi:hypothetical protein
VAAEPGGARSGELAGGEFVVGQSEEAVQGQLIKSGVIWLAKPRRSKLHHLTQGGAKQTGYEKSRFIPLMLCMRDKDIFFELAL